MAIALIVMGDVATIPLSLSSFVGHWSMVICERNLGTSLTMLTYFWIDIGFRGKMIKFSLTGITEARSNVMGETFKSQRAKSIGHSAWR